MRCQHDRRRFLLSAAAAGALVGLGEDAPGSGSTRTEDNPRVRPGRVRWHADFSRACAASRASGKPVFLFHMMGRLDQRFC